MVTCIKQAINTRIPHRTSNTSNYLYILGDIGMCVRKHDAAREAFPLWIDNGRPRQGSICDEMRKTRSHLSLLSGTADSTLSR